MSETKNQNLLQRKLKKCPNCKGYGFVQPAPDVKGFIKCPVCNGTGEAE